MKKVCAYLLTWTTYGAWLPGDSRGWVDRHRRHGDIFELPDPHRRDLAKDRMNESAVRFDAAARQAVEGSIRMTAEFKGWFLLALSVRSNHVHVVIQAEDVDPGMVVKTLKAHASKALNARFGPREHWWTRESSKRYLNSDEDIHAAVEYVQNQDVF